MRAVKCPRCNAVCLLAMVDGFKAAVDPAHLDAGGVRAVLIAGRSVYATVQGFKLRNQPRRLRGLRLLTASTLGAHMAGAGIVGEHGCGNAAFSGVPIDAPAKPLSAPVCDLRQRGGWVPPFECPRARHAPPGDSEVMPRSCEACEAPPFDRRTPAQLIKEELGGTVVSIDIGGRNVYTRP